MKNKDKVRKLNRKHFASVIFVIISLLVWGGVHFTPYMEKFDFRVYDILLGLKKSPKEAPEILLVDIDDTALNQMGPWPWTRDIIADTLLRIRELGAKTAVFDIEYLSASKKTVDENLIFEIQKNPEEKINEIQNIYKDYDDFFARSIQFFGNTWLTINAGNLGVSYKEGELDYCKEKFLYDVKACNGYVRNENDYGSFTPAIFDFMKRAKGAGFTNVVIDSDGSRRRIKLFIDYKDGSLGQLSFAPLLKSMNADYIERNPRSLVIKGATLPGSDEKVDIKIPLDKDGQMLIRWLKKNFITHNEDGSYVSEETSFQHHSVYFVWLLSDSERKIVDYLYKLDTLEKFNFCDSYGTPLRYRIGYKTLLSDWENICEYKNYILEHCNGYNIDDSPIDTEISDEDFAQYFALRNKFFSDVWEFAVENYFDEVEDSVNGMLEMLSEDDLNQIFDVVMEKNSFADNAQIYMDCFQQSVKMFENKFCIIGDTGSSTTDLGTTPFNTSYPNVGTHANVYNTIVQRDFITPVDWYWGVAFAVILCLVTVLVTANMKVPLQIVIGLVSIFVIIALPAVLIIFAGIYMPCVSAILITITTFLMDTVYSFRASDKERKFITNAFSQCLAPEVVDEIRKNPDSFKLGGEQVEMTAIFTDIQKFSSFSELLTAAQLVALLNYYLTKMSDIIMDERGLVDKYEGDAIVALVGAPVKMNDHAARAVRAALKMKKSEIVMNKEIVDVAGNPKPEDMSDDLYDAFKILVENGKTIFTRIGLNSGLMVAGYMGSENKKNFTMMGNDVNLASRLEGVNKQYSTGGILISEATRNLLGDDFVLRRLDRVQVVNVNTPIQLYEPLGMKETASEKLLQYIEDWEKAVDLFRDEKYEESLKSYKDLLARNGSDKVAKYYVDLLSNFFTNGKCPEEKDNWGVAWNPDVKAFRLLQK